MDEFEAVFAKYLGEGGPVEVKSATEYMEDIQGLTAEGAKDLKKDMEKNVKKTVDYEDFKLEGLSLEDLEQLEVVRQNKIKNKTIEESKIAGELVLNILKGDNLCKINGKEQFAFKIEMPSYDNNAKLKKSKEQIFYSM